jgi:N-acetylmuramoyl-L-alanine amidase CwlA
MEIKKCYLTKNSCYKKAKRITPKGIVVHSTGSNNPNLKRYVQPDDNILGKNSFGNHWNRGLISKCVHGFIGYDKNKVVRCYQTLPFNYACWGVGSGKKGSYNYSPAYIQFEICEDNLKNEKYFNEAFGLAIEFCAYLCEKYNLSVDNVISHHEAYKRGYGSNHGDCDHWLKKFGKDMDWFRSQVKAKLNNEEPAKETTSFFGKKGYFSLGDRHNNIGKIAEFMYKTFPSYTKKEALGNYYGKNLKASITEFQKRTKLEPDGCVGKLTLAKLRKYGFKG